MSYAIIPVERAKKIVIKRLPRYLVHMVLNDVDPNGMEDVKMVRHFPGVFPDNLPRLPPGRDVGFTIELSLGANLMLEIGSG